MSNFDSNTSNDRSGRAQKAGRETQLLTDLSKGIDQQHHNTSQMHEFGSAFDAPQAVSPGSSGVGSVGQAPSPARSDHQHGAEVPTLVFPVGINGWTNYSGGWLGTRYYKMNGRVFLEGLVTGGTMGSAVFQLAVGYRPLGHLMFATICQNVLGRINVMNDGNVYFEPGLGTNGYCSLNCNWLPGA